MAYEIDCEAVTGILIGYISRKTTVDIKRIMRSFISLSIVICHCKYSNIQIVLFCVLRDNTIYQLKGTLNFSFFFFFINSEKGRFEISSCGFFCLQVESKIIRNKCG